MGRPRTTSRIVIVEDDSDVAVLTGLMLEAEGYEVATFPSGEEALSFIESHANDTALALLDITLKGQLDGFDVCRRLKSERKTRDIPVIFFTADPSFENRLKARECGGQALVVKPFTYDGLVEEVRKATGMGNGFGD